MATVASTNIPKWGFLVGIAAYAVLVGILLVESVRHGQVVASVVAGLCASIIPVAILAQFMEHRSVGRILTYFHEQSFAFLFGDSIFLPFSAAMAALAWRNIPREGWRVSGWWGVASALIGVAAACLFRFVNDKPAYQKAGAMGSFNAPSKLVHDFVAYPIWFGGLVCVGVPLFVRVVRVSSGWPLIHPEFYAASYLLPVLAGVGLWFAVGLLHDQHLNPLKLHPNNWVWSR